LELPSSRQVVERESRDLCKGVQAPGGHFEGHSRAAEDQEQEVVGLFLTYDAGASFTNQDAGPVNMPLAFTEEYVKSYDVISAQLATSFAKMTLTGDKLVGQFVKLCACEVKFLYGCSVPWDKLPVAGQSASADQESDPASVAASRSPSPKPRLTQAQAPSKAQAFSSGGEEDDDGDNGNNNDSDAYGSGDDRR
jgi:hypothetical protein